MTDQVLVGIVEDHPVFRRGLAGLVEDDPGLQLAFAVRSIGELDAELALGDQLPDTLLLDVSRTRGDPQGADAVAHVHRSGVPILVVSADADRATVVAAVGAGATGYVSKDSEPAEIVRAMYTVAARRAYFAPTLAGFVLDEARAIQLTHRETEVLRLVAGGDKDTDIANELFISIHTVHSHLDRIRAKTGHHRRVDLTRYAIHRGLLPPPTG